MAYVICIASMVFGISYFSWAKETHPWWLVGLMSLFYAGGLAVLMWNLLQLRSGS